MSSESESDGEEISSIPDLSVVKMEQIPTTSTSKPKPNPKNNIKATTPSKSKQSYAKMVTDAIISLNEKNGTSLQAIKKFIKTNYTELDENKSSIFIKRYLKKAIDEGNLQTGKSKFRYKLVLSVPIKKPSIKKIEKQKNIKVKGAVIATSSTTVAMSNNKKGKIKITTKTDKIKVVKSTKQIEKPKAKLLKGKSDDIIDSSENDEEDEVNTSENSSIEIEKPTKLGKILKRKSNDKNNNETITKKIKTTRLKKVAPQTIMSPQPTTSKKTKPRKSLNHSLVGARKPVVEVRRAGRNKTKK